MKFKLFFANSSVQKRFEKKLMKISDETLREKIMSETEKLSLNPYPGGKNFKTLKPPVILFRYAANHRIRVGDYRVLYDVDSKKKIVWILALRKRSEKTYK
ncbi:MAG: type II toxin-antitoxin system RelE/ParE family toxin [bacterium]